MPMLWRAIIQADKNSDSGFLFYPKEEIEVTQEFYDSQEDWNLVHSWDHGADTENPVSIFVSENKEGLSYFMSGYSAAFQTCSSFGRRVKNITLSKLTKGIPVG